MKKKGVKIMWMLKSLLASYIVTGILLLVLTFLVYKLKLSEKVVVGGIVGIYVLSNFIGGFIIGKLTGVKKYLWGMLLGSLYFVLLILISYGVYREFQSNGVSIITMIILCLGGGTLGGMLS